MDSSYSVFIGAALSAVGAFLLAYLDDKHKKKIEKKIAFIIFIGAILSSFGAFQGAKESAYFNKHILDTVTGGNSFAYLDAVMSSKANEQPEMVLMNKGDYPLYDLSVRIVDLDEFEAVKGRYTLENIKKADKILSAGNLSSNATLLVGEKWPIFSNKDSYRFNVFILSRSGAVTQNIRFKRIDNEWVRALKVFRDKDKSLKEVVDEKYPKNEKGQIDW